MKIGIIGTGALGGTIAKKLAAAGHDVKVTSAITKQELVARAKELGVAAATIKEVVEDVEVIFVSIPTKAILELPRDLFSNIPDEVIVVDTSNYYPYRDGTMENVFQNKLESVWVSEQLGRPVIKAFNNLLSYTIEHAGKMKGEQARIAMAISGDNNRAKTIVAKLIDDLGFDAVDIGGLSESWRHQPGMPSYCTELNALELERALADGEEIRGKAAHIRDLTADNLMARATPPSHEEMLNAIRSLFSTNPKQHDR